jgi:hypothetical protein
MNPEDIPTYFDKGKTSFEKGNYHEALHFFKESQKTSPSSETSEYISKCEDKIKSKETSSTDASHDNNSNNTIYINLKCNPIYIYIVQFQKSNLHFIVRILLIEFPIFTKVLLV